MDGSYMCALGSDGFTEAGYEEFTLKKQFLQAKMSELDLYSIYGKATPYGLIPYFLHNKDLLENADVLLSEYAA